MAFSDQGSVHDDDVDVDADDDDDDDMSSAESHSQPNISEPFLNFDDSDSDVTMSTSPSERHHQPDKGGDRDVEIVWQPAKWPPADSHDTSSYQRERKSNDKVPCQRCKAYDAHCKSSAEKYKRTLDNYTKTVSELMTGFKKVLERYPELKVDCSDERLYYMVQAALGRNNLVREMVRLSATRAACASKSYGESTAGEIAAVHDALNICYNDADALRLILDRYADLYVRYIQVWREMCAKVSKDITVMELLNYTEGRPGVEHGEPWCEARAYIRRIIVRSKRLAPRSVADYCAEKLNALNLKLARVPRDPGVHKEDLEVLLERMRQRLDLDARQCASDSHMSDLYLDVRSDLAVLDTLVGVGSLSAKTLLHERHLLVCQIRKLVKTQGCVQFH
ncbi:insulin expression enhancer protein ISL-2 [Sarotherodon galilaeus]